MAGDGADVASAGGPLITVLHVITSLDAGGAERMLAEVATYGHDPPGIRQVVVSLMDEGVYGSGLRAAAVPVYCLGMRRGSPSLRGFVKLVRLLREERPNVVMTWLYHADLAGTLASLTTGIRRVIWNVRCSDVEMESYARVSRWTLALLSRLSKVPWGVATNSVAGRDFHERLGYVPRRWFYLPNGVDVDEWRPDAADRSAVRAEFGIDDDALLIGIVGRVDPMKDHANFFAAAERVHRTHPAVDFLVVGEGTESLMIPAALRGRVRLTGYRSDVPRLLRGLDLLVMSSGFGEGFPNAVAEAMATAIPCVVTDVGDAAAMVGETGRVVPPRDSIALATAIEGLIAEGRQAMAHLGGLARARVGKTWSIDRVARAYRDLWIEAAAGSVAGASSPEMAPLPKPAIRAEGSRP